MTATTLTMTALTYNCDPTSLGGVERADFVDALENEIAAWNPTAVLTVTFRQAISSRVESASAADGQIDPETINEAVTVLAEKAWQHCLRGERAMAATTLTANVQVRRHNGQCAFGEIAEHDADEGRVERGGSIWLWRKQ
jgi:hypothetical protein